MLAILAPGQGAQTPGFLAPWLDDPAARDQLAALSEVAGVDLAHYGTEADAETIRATDIAQPLLVAAGVVAGQALLTDGTVPDVVAGHSVGEIPRRRSPASCPPPTRWPSSPPADAAWPRRPRCGRPR